MKRNYLLIDKSKCLKYRLTTDALMYTEDGNNKLIFC